MADAVFSSLNQSTLRASALHAIRNSILDGTIRPGQQLVQADIASQMNVSRAPVREALRQLEEEGLVQSVPYKGTFVTPITRRDILELYSLRGTLEAMAVRLAIENDDGKDLEELTALFDQMTLACQTGDTFALNSLDLEFHTTLCVLSRHGHLIRNWQNNSTLIQRILSFRNRLSSPQVVVERHRPLLDAFRNKDVSAAQRIVEEHCISSGEALAAMWPDDDSELTKGGIIVDANPSN